MKKILIVDGGLAKAHVGAYTRKDGTFVAEHDDKRTAAAPKPAAGAVAHHDSEADRHTAASTAALRDDFDKGAALHDKAASAHERAMKAHKSGDANAAELSAAAKDASAKADAAFEHKGKPKAFDHPNVVAENVRMTSSHYEPGKGSSEKDAEDPADADTVHFAGKRYSWTSKTGKSNHDGTPVRAYEHEDSGHRVWVDDKRRVHADSTDEVESLRKQHADHQAGAGAAPAKKKVVVRKEAAAAPAKKPTTPDEVKDHAMAAGAKFRSGVAVFGSAENAHSYADRSAGSKGGAFVMKHPDHKHHVVVNGADSQRMEKNGYQHARRT